MSIATLIGNMANLIRQKTLNGTIEFSGQALHTGAMTSVRVGPAEAGTGYVFRRTDLPGAPEVAANVHNIRDTQLATSLGFNGAAVKTVEHLLSALAGCGVDNALILVAGDEVPIMDGSAAPFVRGIEDIGLAEQDAPKKLLRIRRPLEVSEGQARAAFSPAPSFSISFVIEFDHPAVGRQSLDFAYTPEAYREKIAYARTFGFLRDVRRLAELGLAQGGSVDNAIVVGDEGVVNAGGLRSPDEFVRHKILDTVGDLSLVGIPIIGRYEGFRAGHRINRLLMAEILRRPSCWDLVHLEEGAGRQTVCRRDSGDLATAAASL